MEALKSAAQKTVDGTHAVYDGVSDGARRSVKVVGSVGSAGVKAVGSVGNAGVNALGTGVKAVGSVGNAGVNALGTGVTALGSVGMAGVKGVGTAGKVVVLDPLKHATKFAIVDPMKRMSIIPHDFENDADDEKAKEKRPERLTPPPPPVWTEITKANALEKIREEMSNLENKIVDNQKLQDHNQGFVAARLDADNKIGAVLSMKQVLKFRANTRAAGTAITALEELSQKVEHDEIQFEYEQELKDILAAPPQPISTDNEEILDEAKKFTAGLKAAEAAAAKSAQKDGQHEMFEA